MVDISDIAAMLAQRIEALCADVLPLGRREGRDWVEANRASGGLGDSLRVCLVGSRRGVWKHFGADAGGDALELINYVLFSGGDKPKAVMYARQWLGIDSGDPKKIELARAKAREAAKKQEAAEAETRAQKMRFAQAIWHNASPRLAGSPVDLYLLGRGIGLGDMAKAPGAIRFAERLRHGNGQEFPAMVAQVNNADGAFVAVHRTYLHSPQPGVFTKAPLGDQAKMVLGSYAGGFVSIQRGASNLPFNRAPEGDAVILCEGIEDGLSLALACPAHRVLACIAVGNFKAQKLHPNMKRLVIAADNDAPGSPAAQALQGAIDKFIDEGREVFVTRSPLGKDFNDCLRGAV